MSARVLVFSIVIALLSLSIASDVKANSVGITVTWGVQGPVTPDKILNATLETNGEPKSPGDFISATRSDYLQGWSISIASWVSNGTSIVTMSNIASATINYSRIWPSEVAYDSVTNLTRWMSRFSSDVHRVTITLTHIPVVDSVKLNGVDTYFDYENTTRSLSTGLTFSDPVVMRVGFFVNNNVNNPTIGPPGFASLQEILAVAVVLIAFAFAISIFATVIRRRR